MDRYYNGMVLLGFQLILRQEQLDLKVLPVLKVLKEQLVVRGLRGHKDPREIQDLKDPRGCKELPDQSDLQGRLVQMEQMETGTLQHRQIHFPSPLVQKI
jgi:hypothetical protein